MRAFLVLAAAICMLPRPASGLQIVAGSPEEKLFTQITAETDAERKLQQLSTFEKQFPASKAMVSVYLMEVELFRQKDDRPRMIEYGEKVLNLDARNVTAMMVLSRNYAIERKNLDRAVELAQKAVDLIGAMKTDPPPSSRTAAEWDSYLQATDAAARSILEYAKSIKGSEKGA